MFGEPVYIFAQAGRPGAAEMEVQRRLDEQRKRLMEEEIRRQRELQQRLEAERRAKLGPGVPAAVKPPPVVKAVGPAVPVAQSGWYYFVDPNVDPDARYDYSVIIVCKNPIFGAKKQYETGNVPKTVSSRPVSTATSLAPVVVEEFKKWWFQGGTPELETGTFKVRCLVGGRRDITDEDIRGIVAECSATAGGTTVGPKPVKKSGPEEVWTEQNFPVRPGEEIGGKATVTVNGEKREVDFATGCTLVSVWTDVQVTEDPRKVTVMVPGKETPESVERIYRVVHPGKLRIAYVDRKGKMKTRWQEVAPPMLKTGAAE
jgi:hypothetical protein